ncbi:MAG: hypothetical protein ACRC80_31825, partial [Waterburya sp.]
MSGQTSNLSVQELAQLNAIQEAARARRIERIVNLIVGSGYWKVKRTMTSPRSTEECFLKVSKSGEGFLLLQYFCEGEEIGLKLNMQGDNISIDERAFAILCNATTTIVVSDPEQTDEVLRDGAEPDMDTL